MAYRSNKQKEKLLDNKIEINYNIKHKKHISNNLSMLNKSIELL